MIYTFYSFKGGVGRSMAVANLAECFHAKGLRVVVVDWDLEAPGLDAYFFSGNKLALSRAHMGLLDMLTLYRQAFSKTEGFAGSSMIAAGNAASHAEEAAAVASASIRESHEEQKIINRLMAEEPDVPAFLLQPIKTSQFPPPSSVEDLISQTYRDGNAPRNVSDLSFADPALQPFLQCVQEPESGRSNGIYMISAGARPEVNFAQYASGVQELDWTEFYGAYEGRQYFDWLRRALDKSADAVFIDSRTGFTEMGGVCTRQMADSVISFCAPNFQNMDGVARVVAGLNNEAVKKVRDGREVDVLVIPTRIDRTESDRLELFRQSFDSKVETGAQLPRIFSEIDSPQWNLRIPYIPRYNYMETLVIGPTAPVKPDPATQDLVDAYTKLAIHLAALAPSGRANQAYSVELLKNFPSSGTRTAPNQAPAPPEDWVPRPEETAQTKKLIFQGASSPRLSKIALCGAAGTGKTALAATLCYAPDVIAAFPDGILWISFSRFFSKTDFYDFLRSSFGIGRRVNDGAVAELVASKKFLLVIDDVWDFGNLQDLENFGRSSTQLLITRNASIASWFAGANILALGTFTEEQSQAMLKNLPQPAIFDESTRTQAELLRRLPLGASLLRTAFERGIAQKQTRDQAFQNLCQSLLRHGVLAFDTPGATDRNLSLSTSLRQSLANITAGEKKMLVVLAKAAKGMPMADAESALLQAIYKLGTSDSLSQDEQLQISMLFKPEASRNVAQSTITPRTVAESAQLALKHLADLGLVRVIPSAGGVKVDELMTEYLSALGELGGDKSVNNKGQRISSSDGRYNNQDVERANAILRGQSTTLDETQLLAEKLKDSRYFGLARRLFRAAYENPDTTRLPRAKRLRLVQRWALCTYRDPDLPLERFDRALSILQGQDGDLNDDIPSQESLGLAGAIYKNKWRFTGRHADLEQSFSYYNRGWMQPLEGDFGYTGINAAFVLDLLASIELADSAEIAADRRKGAQEIRSRIAADLPPLAGQRQYSFLQQEWWYYSTLAEACSGIGRYEEARYWLREGMALNPPDWQLESSARQLAKLAYAQNPKLQEDSEELRTLSVIAGDAMTALHGIEIGKVGLALSGGGFRASLFHIGVLARLAELDILGQVEVLSCVSGGSIIGAHYYLEVRRLLQSKADYEITREDYIEIVRRLEKDFLDGVQKNLRTRLLCNLGPNLLSLVMPDYTRTRRLGSLYEKHLYSRVQDGETGHRYMENLRIMPKGWDNFNPKLDNWRRSSKIPILLLNATALNTGHNWQFSVSFMGEPPAASTKTVDRNETLRRMYYWEAPQKYLKPRNKIRLGHAVAASSCVPALFDPIEFSGLYPDRTVRLVDGGVHDNQGVGGLLEQECGVILVSDASGQMNSAEHPSAEISAVPLRANSILMSRVRETEALQLDALRNSSALNGLMFLHMKQDLDAGNVDWVDCKDPYEPLDDTNGNKFLTSYGIPKTVQTYLAGLRTDLDSFSDREAYALMLSGYRMTDENVRDCLPQFPTPAGSPGNWSFMEMEPVISGQRGQEADLARLTKVLKIGASGAFKIWKIWPQVGILGGLSIFAALGVPLIALWDRFHDAWLDGRSFLAASILTFGRLILMFGLATFALWICNRLIGSRKSFSVIVTGLLLGSVGWLVGMVHLLAFDPLFLLSGSMRKRTSSGFASFMPLVLIVLLTISGAWLFIHSRAARTVQEQFSTDISITAKPIEPGPEQKATPEPTPIATSTPTPKKATSTGVPRIDALMGEWMSTNAAVFEKSFGGEPSNCLYDMQISALFVYANRNPSNLLQSRMQFMYVEKTTTPGCKSLPETPKLLVLMPDDSTIKQDHIVLEFVDTGTAKPGVKATFEATGAEITPTAITGLLTITRVEQKPPFDRNFNWEVSNRITLQKKGGK